MQVRNTGIRVLIDGQLMLDYPTDYHELSANKSWSLPDSHFLGLGAYGPMIFHSVKVIEIGSAPEPARVSKPVAADPPASSPQAPPAGVRGRSIFDDPGDNSRSR